MECLSSRRRASVTSAWLAAVAVLVVGVTAPVARAADTVAATPSAAVGKIRTDGLDDYGGVRPWMSADEVRAMFGEPAKTSTQPGGPEVWRYPAVAVVFDRAGRGVSGLFIIGNDAPRIAGVGIGSSEAEILAALGEPVIPLHRTSVGGATLRYGSDTSRVVFMLEKDRGVRLIGISWFKTAADATADPGLAGR